MSCYGTHPSVSMRGADGKQKVFPAACKECVYYASIPQVHPYYGNVEGTKCFRCSTPLELVFWNHGGITSGWDAQLARREHAGSRMV